MAAMSKRAWTLIAELVQMLSITRPGGAVAVTESDVLSAEATLRASVLLVDPRAGRISQANETDAPNRVPRFRQPEAGGT
jgi:hypothetical protein